MISYYLKYTLRSFRSKPLIFSGSVASVFLGVLCIALLATYVNNELSMNGFHTRTNDIYLLTIQHSPESEMVAIEASLFFKFNYKDFPDLEALTTVKKYQEGEIHFRYDKTSLSTAGIVTDSMFLKIFDFKLVQGDPNIIFRNLNSVIISQNFADRLFGKDNPIGKTVELRGEVQNKFTVEGIVESPLSNSSLTFDFILPDRRREYSRTGGEFILTGKNFDKTGFIEKIRDLGHTHPQFKESRMDVLNFGDIYFANEGTGLKNLFSKSGNRKNIRILLIIIAVIFIITLLNFSNLQIININSSLKNIGINSIAGAGKQELILQKITDLMVLILFSSVLIYGAFKITLPYFNTIVGVELAPNLPQILLLSLSVLSIHYTFLEDVIEKLYHKEKRLSSIYILFTIIALAISAIGLYAISLYDTKRRTKEIGIRKVNGATIPEILLLLIKDFVKWVAIAFVIATPIAYYAMNNWLQNFAYKTELSWWIFALAGLLALGIALLTVSWQSWRAAVRNPVEALRYE
jgi:putative ABC transport system permease protein